MNVEEIDGELSEGYQTEDYENGVEEFLQFAQTNAQAMWGKYFCPCVKCANGRRQIVNDIRTHLIFYGIVRTNTKWIWKGNCPIDLKCRRLSRLMQKLEIL